MLVFIYLHNQITEEKKIIILRYETKHIVVEINFRQFKSTQTIKSTKVEHTATADVQEKKQPKQQQQQQYTLNLNAG